MEHKLTEFLSTPTLKRKDRDYEDLFDDFVSFCSGARVRDLFEIPDGKQNADYFIPLDKLEIVLELKQITKYEKYNSVDEYFLKELSKGKLRKLSPPQGGKITILPESLPKSEWDKFYKRFRPSVSNNLNKAASQLRDTESFLPVTNSARVKGVILFNSGDYNLPTDLLFRLAEWKLAKEWKMGNYNSIDFVSCLTIDMYKEGQSPLHARHIVKTLADQNSVNAVAYLYDRWIYYTATAFGLSLSFEESGSQVDKPTDLNTPFQGKIKYELQGS